MSADSESDPVIGQVDPDFFAGIRGHERKLAAGRRELDRVPEQVPEDLLEPGIVAVEPAMARGE